MHEGFSLKLFEGVILKNNIFLIVTELEDKNETVINPFVVFLCGLFIYFKKIELHYLKFRHYIFLMFQSLFECWTNLVCFKMIVVWALGY